MARCSGVHEVDGREAGPIQADAWCGRLAGIDITRSKEVDASLRCRGWADRGIQRSGFRSGVQAAESKGRNRRCLWQRPDGVAFEREYGKQCGPRLLVAVRARLRQESACCDFKLSHVTAR